MIEKIVQTAKQAVKAKVLTQSADLDPRGRHVGNRDHSGRPHRSGPPSGPSATFIISGAVLED